MKRFMRCVFVLGLVIVGSGPRMTAATTRVPTIDDLLTIKTVGGAQISPDGKWVAYTVSETDFAQDAYVRSCGWSTPRPGSRCK